MRKNLLIVVSATGSMESKDYPTHCKIINDLYEITENGKYAILVGDLDDDRILFYLLGSLERREAELKRKKSMKDYSSFILVVGFNAAKPSKTVINHKLRYRLMDLGVVFVERPMDLVDFETYIDTEYAFNPPYRDLSNLR